MAKKRMAKKRGSAQAAPPRVQKRLRSQLGQHRFHFPLRVQIAGAPRRRDPVIQHNLGVASAASLRQRLRRHKVTRSIVGTVLQQNRKLRQRTIQISLPRIFHRQSITREAVVRILRQYVVERGNSVHNLLSISKQRRYRYSCVGSQRPVRYSRTRDTHVGTAAPGCPVERSSTVLPPPLN